MQRDLGHQAGLKATEVMRALPIQTAGVVELVGHGLDDLAYPSQPAAQALGPGTPAGQDGLGGQSGCTEIVNHDIKHRQEGIHIDHNRRALSWGGDTAVL